MSDAKDDIIDIFRKGILPYKGSTFRIKKEESEEESEENKLEKIKMTIINFSNILKMNQLVLTMICLKIIFIL